MDGDIELVCGAFSSTRQKSRESGEDLYLPPERVYGTYREMVRKESKLPPEERMDFLTIVTPNNMHYPISMAALDGGFHVVCDRPMTLTLDEARNLKRKIKQTGRMFCVTQNVTGYSTVQQAREMVAKGKLGRIRRVVVEHAQGWLASRLETTGHKQAAWRTDPRRIGVTGCVADIGEEGACLAEYVVGSPVTEVSADLVTFVKGRPVDDDGSVLWRFENGAHGVLWTTQIAGGEEEGLRLRVFGEKASLSWREKEAGVLSVTSVTRPTQVTQQRTPPFLGGEVSDTLLPGGHTEGFLDSFANIYRAFGQALHKVLDGRKLTAKDLNFPTVDDGMRGVLFLDAVLQNVRAEEKWGAVET